jgi:hypothetical protein
MEEIAKSPVLFDGPNAVVERAGRAVLVSPE